MAKKRQSPMKVPGTLLYDFVVEKEILYHMAKTRSDEEPFVEKKVLMKIAKDDPRLYQAINFLINNGYLVEKKKEGEYEPSEKAIKLCRNVPSIKFLRLEEERTPYDDVPKSKQYTGGEGLTWAVDQ